VIRRVAAGGDHIVDMGMMVQLLRDVFGGSFEMRNLAA
jgi:hypothetical protein